MGPHGLIIGATGSGKSELLRTIVAVAGDHPLVRGAQLRPGRLQGRRHVRLAGRAAAHQRGDHQPRRRAAAGRPDAGRARRRDGPPPGAAAGGRQLRLAATSTRRPGSAGEPLAPLPSLLIICDEFSELLAAKPDFIDLFVMIGRLGRSLGVHLLLASQRLEEGRLRGLDTHLSYRIGLRTFSAVESRIVLGVPDAYELPNAPGHGYLKTDTQTMLRFRAAYVSGPYRRRRRGRSASQAVVQRRDRAVRPRLRAGPGPAGAGGRRGGAGGSRPSRQGRRPMLDVIVDQLRGSGAAGAPGLAAAAGRAADPRRAARRRWRSTATAAWSPRRLAGRRAARRSRSASWTGRSSSAATRSWSSWPAPAATWSSSAARSRARAPCCAR